MLTVVEALLFANSAVEATEHQITDIFKALATPSEAIYNLSVLAFAVTGAIFVVVAGLLTYAIVRFRRRHNDDDLEEPPQVYGSTQIEIAWTVIPILIVFVLTGVTARVVAALQDAKPPKSAVQATVIGHQWWWEIKYPELGVVTANELHIPLSATRNEYPTFLKLQSADVNHSFWVPQLSGKTDLLPNRTNEMWLDPRKSGLYLGNCAEYCGTQHANMLIRVVVQPKAEFDRWIETQKKLAMDQPQAVQGKRAFESLSCVNCHVVNGSPSERKFGPNLTHLMSRHTLASGVIDNTPKNLRAWINDPQEIKPGCLMPSMKLSDKELDQVVSYLQTLQ